MHLPRWSWVLAFLSSATGSLLMRCTHVELWPNIIFEFWVFTDNLKSHSICAEQSQIHPHTPHRFWIKSCEGISNMVANMWWSSTWIGHCGSESHLVALLLVCQTLPHNSVSNFCGMFMDVTNTEFMRFRYFTGTRNQLQWRWKCCVCHASQLQK